MLQENQQNQRGARGKGGFWMLDPQYLQESTTENDGLLSSFSVVDFCKYCGSNIQKPPFPGSSLVLLIFLKHLLNDKLWWMEFCKNRNKIIFKFFLNLQLSKLSLCT